MTRTLPYAKVFEIIYPDEGGYLNPATDVEVIDLATGAPPVDAVGRRLSFFEVNAAEGWGMAYDNDAISSELIRIERPLEIRVLPREA